MSEYTKFFPVQLHTKWCSPNEVELLPHIADWLLDPTSLTARLKGCCKQFSVKVLGQKIEPCSKEDACEVVKVGTEVLVREVLLFCDDKPQVFARSLLPLSSLTGEEQVLAHLGEQPLGQVIFSKPNLVRFAIEVSELSESHSVAELAKALSLSTNKKMWGRRSLFYLEDKPLVVAEVFLPNAFAYQELEVS